MNLNIISLFLNATLVVKVVIVVLVVMSVISWAIIFYKFFLLISAKRKVLKAQMVFDDSGSLSKIINYLRSYSPPVSGLADEVLKQIRVFERKKSSAASVKTKKKVLETVLNRALDQRVISETERLSYGVSFLATCTNSAPFIGLFGTVWGIMHSFHSIGLKKSASLAVVAPGIAEALIATAIGLAVAIPASMAYNFFLGILNTIEIELSYISKNFINRISIEMDEDSSL